MGEKKQKKSKKIKVKPKKAEKKVEKEINLKEQKFPNLNIQKVELSDAEKTLIMEVNMIFSSLDKYPLSISYHDYLILKKKLIDIYKRALKYPWLTQDCLFRINERLGEHFLDGGIFKSTGSLLKPKEKITEEGKREIRAKVYNSFFRPTTSLFVILELIDLLGELAKEDIYALKLLTRYFSYILLKPSEFDRIIKINLIDSILKTEKEFGLLTLSAYLKYTPDISIRNYLIEMLNKKYSILKEKEDVLNEHVVKYLEDALNINQNNNNNINMHY